MNNRGKKTDPKFVSCLVCESIRLEVTGKQTIVGVYGDDIIMLTMPGQILLGLYIRCIFLTENIYNIRYRILGSKNEEISTTMIAAKGIPNKTSVIAIDTIPVMVTEPGIV